MQLGQLRAFVSVIDTGGFSAAAGALDRTQSAISHAVASLEEELASPLLHRGRDGTLPTQLGDRILPHARSALRHIEGIADEARSARSLRHGRLRIGGFPTACQLLPGFVAALRRAHPGIDVVLWEGTDDEVHSWLEQSMVDLGVRARLNPPESDEILLATDRMLVLVDPQHPLAGQPSLTPADLSEDWMLVSDGGCEPLLAQLHQTAGIRFHIGQRVREMTTLLAMVREGLGITVIPELALTDPHGLVAIPLQPDTPRNLILASSTTPPTATARAFQELVRQHRTMSAVGDEPLAMHR